MADRHDAISLFERGRAWYREKQYDKAIADFDRLLTSSEPFVGARYLRALAFSRKGEYDRAIKDFDLAIRDGLETNCVPDCYYNRGRCWYLEGEIDHAIKDFNEAIRLNPQHAKAYMTRGLAWQRIGEFPKAINDFDLAIHNDPSLVDSYHNRGNAWVHLGKFRKGIADLSKAIQLEPSVAATYRSRGVAWKRKGRYAEALADYERAFEIDPESAEHGAALAEFLATCPQDRFRDGPRALELIRNACERTGYSSADYVSCLAAVHAELGDLHSAILYQRKAIAICKEDDDKEVMRQYMESYEAGEPCFFRTPTWRDRWS